jgi:hypothetical protein
LHIHVFEFCLAVSKIEDTDTGRDKQVDRGTDTIGPVYIYFMHFAQRKHNTKDSLRLSENIRV